MQQIEKKNIIVVEKNVKKIRTRNDTNEQKINDRYREFHVKVFNTGKLEMPGVQSESMFQTLLNHIICILQPFEGIWILINSFYDFLNWFIVLMKVYTFTSPFKQLI